MIEQAQRKPFAGRLLERALQDSAASTGCPIATELLGAHPWASATFVGFRQAMMVRGEATPAFAAWLAALPEAELAVRGHVVADIAIGSRSTVRGVGEAALSLLVLEDG